MHKSNQLKASKKSPVTKKALAPRQQKKKQHKQLVLTKKKAKFSSNADASESEDVSPETHAQLKKFTGAFIKTQTIATVDQTLGHPLKHPVVVKETYHTNHYGEDKFYNPDEDSDFEPHYDLPPEGVHAFPFASKRYNFSIRFAQDPDKVHNLDIYEGETYFDAVNRQKLFFPDAKCNVDSTHQQEEQFFDGAAGCGGCIGQFPVGYKSKLPDLSVNETDTMRNFWRQRVHHDKTGRDGGKADSIRLLCVTDFTPDMDGVQIMALGTNHPHFNDNIDLIRASESAMI